MKTRFALFIALMLSMAQGFAVPVDSVRNQSSGLGKVSQSENLRYSDSITMRTDFGTVDGFERMDGNANETNYIEFIEVRTMSPNGFTEKCNSLTFSRILVGESSTQEIYVSTGWFLHPVKLTLESDNTYDKNMFSIDRNTIRQGESNWTYPGAKVKVSYNPAIAGTHKARLVLTESTIQIATLER